MTDAQLLGQFVRATSRANAQHAFAGLVRRHVDWVYSAARRMVGDPGLAEDVTQAVFIVLARKAAGMSREPGGAGDAGSLSPWLFNVTRYTAAAARRSRARREHHERQAAAMAIAQRPPADPRGDGGGTDEVAASASAALDEVVARLGRRDREAVLLRFYEQKTFVQIGAATGTSEEAARKRVARAVDKLRDLLTRRGVIVPSAAAATALLGNVVQAAPPALASRAAEAALATGGAAAAATAGATTLALAKGALTMMAITKAKTAALVVGFVCALGGAGAWLAADVLRGAEGGRDTAGGRSFTSALSAAPAPSSGLGSVLPTRAADAPAVPPAPPPATEPSLPVDTRLALAEQAQPPAKDAAKTDAGAEEEPEPELKGLERKLPEVNFDGVGFADVVDFLRDGTGTNIVVDWRALENAGIDRNAPVSVRLRDVSFQNALTTILFILDAEKRLGFMANQEVLTISTREALGTSRRATQTYDLRGVLPGGTGPDRTAIVVKMITGSVDPKSWKENGGAGEVRVQGDGLSVTTSPENQKAIANLLDQIKRLAAAAPAR